MKKYFALKSAKQSHGDCRLMLGGENATTGTPHINSEIANSADKFVVDKCVFVYST